jgi:DNA-binding XRE family transcriptional regulator
MWAVVSVAVGVNQARPRRMRKSVHSKEYKVLTGLLIAARKRADLTQQEVAERLGRPQSFITKVEKGERRIDVVELLVICKALRTDAVEILREVRGSILK